MAKHRIAITETRTVYYEFEGTETEAEQLCTDINEGNVDDLDEVAEFVGDSDWSEQSNARVT